MIPPILDDVPNDYDGNYRVSWQEQNPSANPDYFQLDELKNLSELERIMTESGSELWTLNGFALSTPDITREATAINLVTAMRMFLR